MTASTNLVIPSPLPILFRPHGSYLDALMGPAGSVAQFTRKGGSMLGFDYARSARRASSHALTRHNPAAPLSIQDVAKLGMRAVARLPQSFQRAHRGDFIAIAVNGDLLAIGASFAEVAAELRETPPKADYYVARLGQRSLGEIR